jgi:hypothetical protein
MTHHTTDRRFRIAGIVALTGGALLVLFWVLYFGGIIELGEGGGVISEFEAAFPAADAVLAATLFAAGVGLLRRRAFGAFCLTAAGGATLYLGILDLTFYSRQGLYFPLTATGVVELAVNLLCIVGGAIGLRYGWSLGGGRAKLHVRNANVLVRGTTRENTQEVRHVA